MGFRSTITSLDNPVKWPQWFRAKYEESLSVPSVGAIHSISEHKAHDAWADLPADIQRAIAWDDVFPRFVLVFLHECGGVTRCQIEANAIYWTEPSVWAMTNGITHNQCKGCSDVQPGGSIYMPVTE